MLLSIKHNITFFLHKLTDTLQKFMLLILALYIEYKARTKAQIKIL